MKTTRNMIAGTMMVALVAGCVSTTRQASTVRLPDGDADRGKATFLEMRCNHCHRVVGADVAPPVAQPMVPVPLGSQLKTAPPADYLARSIIDPSHEFAKGYQEWLIKEGKLSRMGDYSDAMTVRQLSDLVAFLQSLYPEKP